MTIDPAAQERARTVAWLRKCAASYELKSRTLDHNRALVWLAMYAAYELAADAIERGDHTHEQ